MRISPAFVPATLAFVLACGSSSERSDAPDAPPNGGAGVGSGGGAGMATTGGAGAAAGAGGQAGAGASAGGSDSPGGAGSATSGAGGGAAAGAASGGAGGLRLDVEMPRPPVLGAVTPDLSTPGGEHRKRLEERVHERSG